MKFALALLFGALISIASAQKNGRWRFRITVTSCRDELPSLSGGLDYDMWGIGGFGRGGNSSGFVSCMNSDPKDPNALPKGNLYREEDLQPAQLIPSGQPGMYNLRFGAIPAGVSGILSTGFAVAPLSCGGQCGGLQVVYSSANAGSKWIAYPDIKYPNGWRIQWFSGKGTPPAGGHNVWLWRNYEA